MVGWLARWLVGWFDDWFDGWLTINLKITLTSELIRRNWAYISHPEVRKRMRVENGEQSGAVRSHLYEKYVYIFKVFSTLDQKKSKIKFTSCMILYKIRSIKQSCSTNTQTIWKRLYQRSLRNSSLLLLVFEFYNFSFLIDTIDNIICTSGSYHQNSNQWQCSIIATCLCLYHVTGCTAIWGGSGLVIMTYFLHIHYICFCMILTQSYVNFSWLEHQLDVL